MLDLDPNGGSGGTEDANTSIQQIISNQLLDITQ